MIAVGPRNRITVDGVTVLPSCAGILDPIDPPLPSEDGNGYAVEVDYCGASVRINAYPMPPEANCGRFRLEVSVPHPECEESDATLILYGYEFPGASRRIRKFVNAVR